jgi:hypothetical protein
MLGGELLGAYCLSEAHAGSDPAAMRTRAVRDGGDYVLTGGQEHLPPAKDAPLAANSRAWPERSADRRWPYLHVGAVLAGVGNCQGAAVRAEGDRTRGFFIR